MKYQNLLYLIGAAVAAFSAHRLARQVIGRRVDVGTVSQRWLSDQRRDEGPGEHV